jgi:hypothetical protein
MSDEIITIPQQAVALTEPQKEAWLGMAMQKNNVVAKLATYQLQLQNILLKVKDSKIHADIDKCLSEYRSTLKEMVDYRLVFTNKVTAGIITPIMAPEKECDIKTNVDYLALVNASLELRQAEQTKANEANVRLAEIARFKAHIENDNNRRAQEYRTILRKEIANQYSIHLRAGEKKGWEEIKAVMKTLDQPVAEKFGVTTLTIDELTEINANANLVDFKAIYAEMMQEFDGVFSNFDNDLAAPDKAIEVTTQAVAAAVVEEKPVFVTPVAQVQIAGPKIKKLVEVIVIDTMPWGTAVMQHFILNQDKINIRGAVSKLTIGQMAAYLGKLATETDCEFKGLILNEVQK